MSKGMSRSLASPVQPLCPFIPRMAIQDIRKRGARLWFLGGVSDWQRAALQDLIIDVQDIQLVVSDPKACNNIFIKDQIVFEETDAILR